MKDYTMLDMLQSFEDSIQTCAGQPVIPASSFVDLATELTSYTAVLYNAEAISTMFTDQTKRFAACGGNHSEKFGVLRKNPKTGWQYLVDLITK